MFKKYFFTILKVAFFRDLVIGLLTTFKYLFKRRVTLNYPNEKGERRSFSLNIVFSNVQKDRNKS